MSQRARNQSLGSSWPVINNSCWIYIFLKTKEKLGLINCCWQGKSLELRSWSPFCRRETKALSRVDTRPNRHKQEARCYTWDGVDEAAIDEELGELDLRHLERPALALLLLRRPIRAAAIIPLAPHRRRSLSLVLSTGWLWSMGREEQEIDVEDGRGVPACQAREI